MLKRVQGSAAGQVRVPQPCPRHTARTPEYQSLLELRSPSWAWGVLSPHVPEGPWVFLAGCEAPCLQSTEQEPVYQGMTETLSCHSRLVGVGRVGGGFEPPSLPRAISGSRNGLRHLLAAAFTPRQAGREASLLEPLAGGLPWAQPRAGLGCVAPSSPRSNVNCRSKASAPPEPPARCCLEPALVSGRCSVEQSPVASCCCPGPALSRSPAAAKLRSTQPLLTLVGPVARPGRGP